jgi:hypothetical protein
LLVAETLEIMAMGEGKKSEATVRLINRFHNSGLIPRD